MVQSLPSPPPPSPLLSLVLSPPNRLETRHPPTHNSFVSSSPRLAENAHCCPLLCMVSFRPETASEVSPCSPTKLAVLDPYNRHPSSIRENSQFLDCSRLSAAPRSVKEPCFLPDKSGVRTALAVFFFFFFLTPFFSLPGTLPRRAITPSSTWRRPPRPSPPLGTCRPEAPNSPAELARPAV